MKSPHSILRLFATTATAAILFALAAFAQTPDQAPQSTPVVVGELTGSRVAVFVSPKDSCNANDVPDAMARAFRDSAGVIHFATASSELFESLGPSLDQLQHSCAVAFNSANDTDPAAFNDQAWLDSFYTLDGKTVAALTHTEYHGWAIKGECHVQGNNQYGACEYDSDTYHQSNDGGYHFESFKAPGNFLAGIPYKYEIDRGPMGYSVDTNIIEYEGWYYAVVPGRPVRTVVSYQLEARPYVPPTFLILHPGVHGTAPISPCPSSIRISGLLPILSPTSTLPCRIWDL